MLSKTEQEYFKNPASFNSNYQRSLRCRLKVKAEKMRTELSLLNATENCSNVAEFCSNGTKLKTRPFNESGARVGAFGGIWTRDHYLTKVTPHRARLRRQILSLVPKQIRLIIKRLRSSWRYQYEKTWGFNAKPSGFGGK